MEINMNENCQFLKDLEVDSRFAVNRGVYNLILSKRDLMLFSKGIKPHRNWKLKDVKIYFGIEGNKQSILNQLIQIDNILKGKA